MTSFCLQCLPPPCWRYAVLLLLNVLCVWNYIRLPIETVDIRRISIRISTFQLTLGYTSNMAPLFCAQFKLRHFPTFRSSCEVTLSDTLIDTVTETVENSHNNHEYKNSTSSAPRQQNKRLCPGSDDSDTDTNTTSVFPRWLVIEAAEPDHSLSKLSPFALGKALQAQIGTLKTIRRLQRGDILVETEKQSYGRMLLGLTQLAGVPVKVSPHRSLNTSRGVIRSRDIADCNVEEIVEELQPQGVTAASIIHVRDGDSRRRTNTVVLTFASPQPWLL